MNGFILLIPFVLIRFGRIHIFSEEGLKRAAFFAPLLLFKPPIILINVHFDDNAKRL